MHDYYFDFKDGDNEGEIIITAETYDKAYKILQSVIDGSYPPQYFRLKCVDNQGTLLNSYHCTKCNRKHRGGTKIFEEHFEFNDLHL